MSVFAAAEYVSTGGNRQSSASDWSQGSSTLAYGADENIALCRPLNENSAGVYTTLRGHNARVTALTFAKIVASGTNETVISGSADGEIRVWKSSESKVWKCHAAVKAHEGAVNSLTALDSSDVFVSGGADAKLKLWSWKGDLLTCLSTIATKPRFIPLALAIARFDQSKKSSDAAFVVAGGTRNDIQLYGVDKISTEPTISHCATLIGHEGWIRSLKLKRQLNGGYLLASTSADKYIRIWKLVSSDMVNGSHSSGTDLAVPQSSLNAKVQKVSVPHASYSISFEALLLGHEDWVYSAAWSPLAQSQQLLSASADGTLTVWEPDETSGIWVSVTRLGEISGQKGATTATGSSGGFWNALWSPDGSAIICLGRTGSWRLWTFDSAQEYWVQRTALTGHVSSVNGLTWSPDGSYLISTSSDQTSRLHAEWRRGTKRTWHEFARPQIHGYDLNCVSATSSTQFASGADEKLLRVFDEPKSTSTMLRRLCNVQDVDEAELPETAAIPVLGLSNKAMDQADTGNNATNGDYAVQVASADIDTSVNEMTEPPTEDLLARSTLWPEREKLYGHGYEISTSASNGDILATACKASSLDHAVIRLYDTKSWTEIRPPLSAHTLTVTRLAWSAPADNLLLSVGRDRQWAVFRNIEGAWQLMQSKEKAHSRMILDAAWSPDLDHVFFATAGRDKTVKLWAQSEDGSGFDLAQSLSRKTAVTAVALTTTSQPGVVSMALGEDDGTLSIHLIDATTATLQLLHSQNVDAELCPSKTITQLAWRREPAKYSEDGTGTVLAVASADTSVRIIRIETDSLVAS